MNHEISKALVRAILENPYEFDWTIQGFGMLRMYPDPEHVFRVNVWDSRYRVKNVSMIHNHPWNFQSKIIVGEVRQFRFFYSDDAEKGERFHRQLIRTGEGGGPVTRPYDTVTLVKGNEEVYEEGSYYSQQANEVHISLPLDGTVTVNRRQVVDENSHAYSFFPVGTEWVTAEPRPATAGEIHRIVKNSLSVWF